jgi:opacity protein-like surface antigen
MLFALLCPAVASADGWISPFFGVNFGGQVPEDREPKTYGVGIGGMGGGIFGFETELSFSPDFFGESDDVVLGSNSVLTWMNNVLIGVPIGGQHGFGVRPFVAGGIGLIRRRAEFASDLIELSSNDFAWDFGGGVMVFFGNNFGIRGDYRYYRNFSEDDEDFDVGEQFNFSRVSGAVVFRF